MNDRIWLVYAGLFAVNVLGLIIVGILRVVFKEDDQ